MIWLRANWNLFKIKVLLCLVEEISVIGVHCVDEIWLWWQQK